MNNLRLMSSGRFLDPVSVRPRIFPSRHSLMLLMELRYDARV